MNRFKEAMALFASVIFKLFGISILFGIIGYSFHIPILGMMVIGFILNYILGTAFTYHYNAKHEKLLVEQNKAIIDYQSNKTASVKCAFCKADNIVPIDLSHTKFKCSKCSKVNRLIVDISTAQVTVPQSTSDMLGGAVEEK